MGIILKPFAWLLLFFYNFFNSYGLALILFAVIIKLILFPVTLQSKKSMIKMNLLSGKMQQLQKQYGKDRERYNIEVQKLYEKEKVNPMGGCVWSLIPMILLIALYYIIRQPMTYFMDLTMSQIQIIADQLDWQTVAVANGWVAEKTMADLIQKLADGEITSVFQNGAYNQLYLASLINESNLAALQTAVGESKLFAMDFSFLWLNLANIPTWKFWEGGITPNSVGLFILPLVSTASSFLSMKVSFATNKVNKSAGSDQVDKTNQMMMWMMPLLSLWIGFTVPAGLSVYWIAQYVVTMAQEVVCGRLLKKDYEAARIAAEQREKDEKEAEKRRKEEARLERARRIEEEKQNRGKKKPAQKKKDDEPEQEGINKNDSREGIRAYARGRAYLPNRFGGVTPYTDPTALLLAQAAPEEKKKKKKAAAGPEEKQEAPKSGETAAEPADQAAEQPAAQEAGEEAVSPEIQAPAAAEPEEVELEEIEVEVEETEIELSEDNDKEGV